MSVSILRYPGGKSKSAHSFVALINGHSQYEYREPFFGGGSVGLQVIMQSDHRSYWINDYDVDIAALWQCVAQHPDEPKAAIMKVVPSLPEFDGLKAYFLSRPPMPSDSAELIRMGCGKLALHRMSWSGVGAMGGPLGGRHQSGRQKIDGRWNPVSLCEKIDKITTRSSGVTITSVDYSELILDESRPAILYLDPPYHGQGPNLYQHAFTDEDHVRLRDLLRATTHKWVLSYDDCPAIRNLYSFAVIREIKLPYSMQTVGTKHELLICDRGVPVHALQDNAPIFDFGGQPDISAVARSKAAVCIGQDSYCGSP